MMATLEVVEALGRAPLLRNLPEESLPALAAVARRRTYRRGEVIFHQGDAGDTLHILQAGRVKVVIDSEAGNEALLNILSPGDSFGELSLIDGGVRSATIEALEPVETLVLQRSDFIELVHQNPRAFTSLLINLVASVRRLSDEVASLASLDLEGRLAQKLLDLAARFGKPVGDGTEIDLPITQEDLAAMIGATRTSVNKVLGWYEDQGAIQRVGRRIIVRDPERLQRRITL
jgi:CRP/FNR family transcriptional regulator, cyclic AMP receptor protein